MFEFYKIGVLVGIMFVYLLATGFTGMAFDIIFNGGFGETFLLWMYIMGLVAFLTLAWFTLEKFGLWGG